MMDEAVEVIKGTAKEKRSSKRVTVRVVGKHGTAVIIERVVSGEAVRLIAPPQALECTGDDATISKDDLDACIPYGVDWSKHLELTVTAEDIVAMLKRRGIWTLKDYEKGFLQVRQGVLGMIMQDVIRMFQSAQKEAKR